MASSRPAPREYFWLVLLTVAAVMIHGYHPYVEDAEIYVPGIRKALNPALYPYNPEFFASHARLTFFPNLIAAWVRLTHLSLDWALLLWHCAAIYLLLLGCWHVGRLCFNKSLPCWGGVTLVASLLTIPIAGTALYIMDQYLNTRSLSTPAALFMIVNVLERKLVRASLWTVFCVLIHPLMVIFAVAFLLVGYLADTKSLQRFRPVGAFVLLPLAIFPPVSGAYRQILDSHSYFFVLRWEWYEWLGLLGPLLLLTWFRRIAVRRAIPGIAALSRALIIYSLLFFVAGLAVSLPFLTRFAELQPMRSLLLVYVFLFVIGGGLLAESIIKHQLWRWLLLFAPLSAGMFWAQRQLFPATPHLEMPGANSPNAWVDTFLWARAHTPPNAYFALDPGYMEAPGEDQHGFRAIAERSRLADRVKDSGAVSMFPVLADSWSQQVEAQSDWKNFRTEDFRRLRQQFGVTWVIWDQAPVSGLDCQYHTGALSVCRIE